MLYWKARADDLRLAAPPIEMATRRPQEIFFAAFRILLPSRDGSSLLPVPISAEYKNSLQHAGDVEIVVSNPL